jgi:hypothetical protein
MTMTSMTPWRRILVGTAFVLLFPLPASAELRSVELAVRGMD